VLALIVVCFIDSFINIRETKTNAHVERTFTVDAEIVTRREKNSVLKKTHNGASTKFKISIGSEIQVGDIYTKGRF